MDKSRDKALKLSTVIMSVKLRDLQELDSTIYDIALAYRDKYRKTMGTIEGFVFRLSGDNLLVARAFVWGDTEEGVCIWGDIVLGDTSAFHAFHKAKVKSNDFNNN